MLKIATFFLFACMTACGQNIVAVCEKVALGTPKTQLPFKVSTPADMSIAPYVTQAGPVTDLVCCTSGAVGCAVDCSLPQYQNVVWMQSTAEDDGHGGGNWCLVAIQNDKVVASAGGFD